MLHRRILARSNYREPEGGCVECILQEISYRVWADPSRTLDQRDSLTQLVAYFAPYNVGYDEGEASIAE